MVKPKMRVFQSQLVGFRNRQHLQDEIFTFSSSSQLRTYHCSWGVGGWNWHLRLKLLERRSALPLCSKYLTPLRFGSVRKMGGGANILGNLGFKTWSLDNISFHDRDDVDDDAAHCPWPTHPFQARGCSLLTHFSCQAPSTVLPSVLPNTVLPTSVAHCVAQCCPPNTVNHPKTLFQVNHRQRFKITILVSKLPLRDCLSTKSGSHNFFYVHQVSRQSDNSPRTRLTLKNLCVFPQQVFPVYF